MSDNSQANSTVSQSKKAFFILVPLILVALSILAFQLNIFSPSLPKLLTQGQQLAQQKHWEKALDIFNQALTIDPYNMDAWNGSLDAVYHLSGYEEAYMRQQSCAGPQCPTGKEYLREKLLTSLGEQEITAENIVSQWQNLCNISGPISASAFFLHSALTAEQKEKLFPLLDQHIEDILKGNEGTVREIGSQTTEVNLSHQGATLSLGGIVGEMHALRATGIAEQRGYQIGKYLAASAKIPADYSEQELRLRWEMDKTIKREVLAPPVDIDSMMQNGFDGRIVRDHSLGKLRDVLFERYKWEASRGMLAGQFELDEKNKQTQEAQKSLLWTTDLSSWPFWIAQQQQSIYVGDRSIQAFDAKNGHLKWSSENIDVVAPPVEIDGRAFFGANLQAQFYAVDANDGHTLWTREFEEGYGALKATPLILDNKIIFGNCSGTIMAVAPEDGSTLWENTISGRIERAPFGTNTVVIFITTVFKAGDEFDIINAVDPGNGQVLWQQKKEKLWRNHVFLKNSILYLVEKKQLSALSASTGKTLWKTTFASEIQPPLIFSSDLLFVNTPDNSRAMNQATGAIKWLHKSENRLDEPLVSDDHAVYLSFSDGRYSGLEAHDADSGELEWVTEIPDIYHWSVLTVYADTLVAVGDKTLFLIEKTSGEIKKKLALTLSGEMIERNSYKRTIAGQYFYYISADKQLCSIELSR